MLRGSDASSINRRAQMASNSGNNENEHDNEKWRRAARATGGEAARRMCCVLGRREHFASCGDTPAALRVAARW